MSDRFRTKDITEAAFLWTQPDVSFLEKETVPRKPGGGVTVFFVFEGVPMAQFNALRKAFYNRQARVEPKAFAQAEQDVRNILHTVLRSASTATGVE